MAQINWSLLSAPVDVGSAIQQGMQYGSALRHHRDERQRRQEFQQSALAAYDPQTGSVNPVAMRSAFAAAGDIEGAMRFDAQERERATSRQAAERDQLTTIARLLDDATDQATYDQGLSAARQLGLDVSTAPPAFDPAWVAQQRRIVAALQNDEEMTTFMRDANAAGIAPGTEAFRRAFETRYAAPPRIMDINGVPTLVQPTSSQGAAPPVLRDEDFMDEGGPTPSASATFP